VCTAWFHNNATSSCSGLVCVCTINLSFQC
jgi:hypothetical protein